MEVGVEVARMQAGFDGLVGAVRAIGTALVMVVGVLRVASGALSPGDLIVFVSYTRKAYNPLQSLARETAKVAATMAKADRIAEILASDEELPEPPGAYRGRAPRATSRSSTCRSPTSPTGRSCATSRCACRPARAWR